MYLLEEQIILLSKGTIATNHQMKQLKEFALFTTTIYSRWFLSHSAANAPWYDLCLYKIIIGYKIVNPTISTAALKAIERHLWYLFLPFLVQQYKTQNAMLWQTQCWLLSPRSFQTDLSIDMGMGLASQYLFPSLNEKTSLADVVEVDSWWVMNVLNLSFLLLVDKDIEQWEEDDAYIESRKTVGLMNVVNDPAERAVKLTAEFVGATRGEEHFQNILQVVEANHKERPNLRRKKNQIYELYYD